MRQLLIAFGIASLLCACGGSDTAPATVEGTWNATEQAAGSSFTLSLSTKDDVVSGIGTYSTAAVRLGALLVAGTYRPPVAVLSFTYDSGDKALYTATVSDDGHMSGKLVFENRTTQDLAFARQ
jgi:major membrane immunogen (membrane-anchored lipoprotein)